MLANVQQVTIKPIIEAGVAKGSQIYTDEPLAKLEAEYARNSIGRDNPG
jgi:hypothetical protein